METVGEKHDQEQAHPVVGASGKRLSALDGLRFLAAASVMLYHYTYSFGDPRSAETALPFLQAITRHGYLGVDVFFLISGFVVLWSSRGRSPTTFARARVLRLYPEFWICVLLSATVFLLIPGRDGFGAGDVPANLTMLPSLFGAPYVDGVYWTLTVEIKFYLILWALSLLRQLDRVELWLYGWLAISLLATVVDVGGAVRSLTIFPYGPLFASGGLFFLVFDAGWSASRLAGLALGLVLSAYQAVLRMDAFVDAVDITRAAEVVTAGVIVLAFAFFSGLGRRAVTSNFRRYTVLAGALTYPLYLLHNTGKAIFLNNTSSPIPHGVLVLTAAVFSVALSYVVMRVGTGPVRGALRSVWDHVLGSSPSERSGTDRRPLPADKPA